MNFSRVLFIHIVRHKILNDALSAMTMTLLGVPTEAQFSIGTSSTTAPVSSGSHVDMSLGKFDAFSRKCQRRIVSKTVIARVIRGRR